MALAGKDSVGGSLPPFFEPDKHAADLALVFEPHKVRKEVPGKYGPRDHVEATVTVFRSQASLEKGEPTSASKVTISQPSIAKDLVELLEKDPNGALIATVFHYQPKNGGNKTWVLRLPTDGDYDLAADWYTKREAALQAALDDVPDFE